MDLWIYRFWWIFGFNYGFEDFWHSDAYRKTALPARVISRSIRLPVVYNTNEKHCIASHVYRNGSCPKWARVNCKENYFPSSIHDKANMKDINLKKKKKVKVKYRCIPC